MKYGWRKVGVNEVDEGDGLRHQSQVFRNGFFFTFWCCSVVFIKIAAVGDLWVCDEFHTNINEHGISIKWNHNF